MNTLKRLDHIGPLAFGYDFDFLSMFATERL